MNETITTEQIAHLRFISTCADNDIRDITYHDLTEQLLAGGYINGNIEDFSADFLPIGEVKVLRNYYVTNKGLEVLRNANPSNFYWQ